VIFEALLRDNTSGSDIYYTASTVKKCHILQTKKKLLIQ